jgi:polyisoprenoid-binding protein YceI
MTQLQTERGMVRVPAGTWRVDPAHSSVGFEVKIQVDTSAIRSA